MFWAQIFSNISKLNRMPWKIDPARIKMIKKQMEQHDVSSISAMSQFLKNSFFQVKWSDLKLGFLRNKKFVFELCKYLQTRMVHVNKAPTALPWLWLRKFKVHVPEFLNYWKFR